jgi:hypothetical protein
MENENRKNFPYGRKAAQGFARRGVHDINHVECPEPPPGLLSMTPLGATKSSPYMPSPAAGEKPRR